MTLLVSPQAHLAPSQKNEIHILLDAIVTRSLVINELPLWNIGSVIFSKVPRTIHVRIVSWCNTLIFHMRIKLLHHNLIKSRTFNTMTSKMQENKLVKAWQMWNCMTRENLLVIANTSAVHPMKWIASQRKKKIHADK